ncbi:Fic family protein [Dyella jejuensis]|uniref:Fic family protein n=1 Tax=Dyella jejuensis TaxID=1432009 RepID=A0ABW8JJS2_9GAMM
MIIERPLVPLPSPGELERQVLEAWDETVQAMRHWPVGRLLPRLLRKPGSARPSLGELDPCWEVLWHELSAVAMKNDASAAFKPGRSFREAHILEDVLPLVEASLASADPKNFLDLIGRIAQSATGTSTGFRTKAVYLVADASGAKVRFAHVGKVLPRIAELHGYLRRHVVTHPLLCALIAMVTITNCHPFMDGNGRTSRILFNAILRSSRSIETYFPLYEMFWCSGCGWEVRLRYTAFTGDWMPLCRYMRDVFGIAHHWLSDESVLLT